MCDSTQDNIMVRALLDAGRHDLSRAVLQGDIHRRAVATALLSGGMGSDVANEIGIVAGIVLAQTMASSDIKIAMIDKAYNLGDWGKTREGQAYLRAVLDEMCGEANGHLARAAEASRGSLAAEFEARRVAQSRGEC